MNAKNILLTALTVLLLLGFAWLVTAPGITEEAAERHMNLENPVDTEEEADDAYSFL